MAPSEISQPYYTIEELAQILRDHSYSTELITIESGRKTIKADAPGFTFGIFTYGPTDDLNIVETVTFRAHFTMQTTLERANKWNMETRFAKARVDSDGEVVVEWDIVMKYVSPAFFRECVQYWGWAIYNFQRY